jgi:hypothetical protein
VTYDEPRSYLVRAMKGHQKVQVFPLRSGEAPRFLRFPLGIAVVGKSLSDALRLASVLSGRLDD